MDENNNNNATTTGANMAQPQPEVTMPMQPQQPQPQMQTQPAPATGVVYASFLERLIAIIIDGVVLMVIGFVLGVVGAALLGEAVQSFVSTLPTVVAWAYFVYLDMTQGATLGKKVMGLRVQNMNTGANLELIPAILREVVGRFLSGIVLLVGYFWMLWDPQKQTWHDKLGNSIVVKVAK